MSVLMQCLWRVPEDSVAVLTLGSSLMLAVFTSSMEGGEMSAAQPSEIASL